MNFEKISDFVKDLRYFNLRYVGNMKQIHVGKELLDRFNFLAYCKHGGKWLSRESVISKRTISGMIFSVGIPQLKSLVDKNNVRSEKPAQDTTLHPVQWAAEPRTILSMKLKNYSIFTILLTNCTSTSPSNSSGDREECGEQQHMELELETKAGLSGTWSAARASWAVVCRAREVLPLLRKAQHGERTPKTTFLWQTGTQD